MASYIHKTIDLTTDDTVIVPLNGRWTEGNYSVVASYAGTGTIKVEGTISRINRGETAIWFDLTGLTAVTANAKVGITNTPVEAFRVTGTTMAGGGATVQILGAGDA